MEKKTAIPRVMWLKKSWNMEEVHRYVFKFITRHVISEWIDWADPNTTRMEKVDTTKDHVDLRGKIIDFPH